LWLATVAFTLMHEPQYWGSTFAAGLCLAWFFERTRHLGAVIVAHGVVNGIHVAQTLP
jgi:membrane protease YdiL (CAAX protease family)